MITLGINAAFHDSAAAIVVDGEVVAAAEEERFTRIKHAKRPLPFSAWELPFNAIDFCLGEVGATLAEVDHVAYSFAPSAFMAGWPAGATSVELPLEPWRQGQATDQDSPWDPLFAVHIVNAPRQLVDGAPHHLSRRLGGIDPARLPFAWHFLPHHLCHQASAFLAAPFERCAVMTLDGRGEAATTTYGIFTPLEGAPSYRTIGEVTMPHSLGMLYERITSHLGFLHSSDEYKVMALAALGTPSYAELLRARVQVGADGQFSCDVLQVVREALNAGFTHLALQGRVNETTAGPARMLPWAVQYFPCLPPAHSVAFGPVNVAVLPFRSITANWRPCLVQRSGCGSGSLSQIALMIASGFMPALRSAMPFGP